eukprot:gnl/Trimastix_PCT/4567.p1 GENE.gnl/Trimastix_PCT/4567~~gnl/Trimastix_PCT/4567.p1  ORF type:complete len:202 (+),score=3.21 gnl/Trimastix_PCT/4567:63-668(+)
MRISFDFSPIQKFVIALFSPISLAILALMILSGFHIVYILLWFAVNSLIVAVVLAFILLHRCILSMRRPSPPHQTTHRGISLRHLQQSLSFIDRDFNAQDYETLLMLDELNRRQRGLPQRSIDRLPCYQYVPPEIKVKDKDPDKGETVALLPQACPICLEQLQVGEWVRSLPCLHRFHRGCIDTWLARDASCPVCKAHPLG